METSTFAVEQSFSSDNRRVAGQFKDGEATVCGRVPCSKVERHCIRLKIVLDEPAAVWDMCQLAMRHGGMKIREYCFAYASREQWRNAYEALSFRFGPGCFEAVE